MIQTWDKDKDLNHFRSIASNLIFEGQESRADAFEYLIERCMDDETTIKYLIDRLSDTEKLLKQKYENGIKF